MVKNNKKTIRNHPSLTFPMLAVLFVFLLISPEIGDAIRSEATANDVSVLITGAITLFLIGGLYSVTRAFTKQIMSRNQRDICMLSLCGVVIGGCLLVLEYVPDTPEAIGVLIFTTLGAAVVLYEGVSRALSDSEMTR